MLLLVLRKSWKRRVSFSPSRTTSQPTTLLQPTLPPPTFPSLDKRKNHRRIAGWLFCCFSLLAIIIGLAVGLTRQGTSASTSSPTVPLAITHKLTVTLAVPVTLLSSDLGVAIHCDLTAIMPVTVPPTLVTLSSFSDASGVSQPITSTDAMNSGPCNMTSSTPSPLTVRRALIGGAFRRQLSCSQTVANVRFINVTLSSTDIATRGAKNAVINMNASSFSNTITAFNNNVRYASIVPILRAAV